MDTKIDLVSTQETLQVWKDSEILRTDLQGSIEFRSNGETIP